MPSIVPISRSHLYVHSEIPPGINTAAFNRESSNSEAVLSRNQAGIKSGKDKPPSACRLPERLAQLSGRDELSIANKVQFDLAHLSHRYLGFDAYILWLAAVNVLRQDNVTH